ncbi:MAG TPA: hypothetical protein VFE05_03240 [Longimicrobiaceae bacterium]|jgi:hypothetical protein|nr:hypothetical protein [Longimicrobiaceae bacterium]
MQNAGYYLISYVCHDTATSSRYSLGLGNGGTIIGGSAEIVAENMGTEYIYVYTRGELTVQAPRGSVTAVALVEATSGPISGGITLSNAIDSDMYVILRNTNGGEIGRYTLRAGQNSGQFRFEVSGHPAMTLGEAEAALPQLLGGAPDRPVQA